MALNCLGLCRSKHIESKSEAASSASSSDDAAASESASSDDAAASESSSSDAATTMHTSQKHYPTAIEQLCHHFSLADLKKSTNNFDKNRMIGTYLRIYKGSLQHNGTTDSTVAIKRIDPSNYDELREFKKEIEVLCQLRHPNLVSLVGFCNHKHEKIIVYEYLPNGSLHYHLYNKKIEPLSWNKRLEICIGAARGVHYLHAGAKRTIIHRNIKPSNILLDSNMVPKISGFEISLQGSLFSSKLKPVDARVAGTMGFLAPECVFGLGGFTDRSDVYSFGAVLLEVMCAKQCIHILMETRKLPSVQVEEMDPDYQLMPYVVQRLRAGEIIDEVLAGKIAPECLKVYIDIMDSCMKYEPNERPTIVDVELELEHALTLQREADARNTGSDYILLPPSITQPQEQGAPISG